MIVLPDTLKNRLGGGDEFASVFSIEGKIYKQRQGRTTLRFTIDDTGYFLKKHQGIGWKELLRYLFQFRIPVLSAKNEWLAIHQLQKLGVPTMSPIGYGRKGWNPGRLKSFLITRELAGMVSLKEFCKEWPASPPGPRLKRKLIEKVAEIARTIHENGINHRDFYLAHFLLDPLTIHNGKDPRLYLIDLHRVQIRPKTPDRWRVKDIAALYFSSLGIGLTKRDRCRFITHYQGKPLRRCLTEDAVFWKNVQKRGHKFNREFIRKHPGH